MTSFTFGRNPSGERDAQNDCSHLDVLGDSDTLQDPDILSMYAAMDTARITAERRAAIRRWSGGSALYGSSTSFDSTDALISRTYAVLKIWPYQADVDLTIRRERFWNSTVEAATQGRQPTVGSVRAAAESLHLDPEQVAQTILELELEREKGLSSGNKVH